MAVVEFVPIFVVTRVLALLFLFGVGFLNPLRFAFRSTFFGLIVLRNFCSEVMHGIFACMRMRVPLACLICHCHHMGEAFVFDFMLNFENPHFG